MAEGKELREFNGETYVMEHALLPDVALVKAHRADKSGNLQFRLTARNFNPAVAMAGKVCIVEVEEIVETGDIEPDQVHLPGIYVHRIVHNPNPEKRIEKRTVSAAPVDAILAKIEAQAAIAQAASTADEPFPSTIKATTGQLGA